MRGAKKKEGSNVRSAALPHARLRACRTRQLNVEDEAAAFDKARDIGASGELRVNHSRLENVGHFAQTKPASARHHGGAFRQRSQLQPFELGRDGHELVLGFQHKLACVQPKKRKKGNTQIQRKAS